MNSNVIKNEAEKRRKWAEGEAENSRFVMINGISGQFEHDTVQKIYTAY